MSSRQEEKDLRNPAEPDSEVDEEVLEQNAIVLKMEKVIPKAAEAAQVGGSLSPTT